MKLRSILLNLAVAFIALVVLFPLDRKSVV